MDINSTRLIYFSPTQTTRKVLEGIAKGIQIATLEHVDVTLPEARMRNTGKVHDALTLIGSPVYSGRLPTVALDRFRKLRGHGAPAVIVVVYGNRAYEDALLELWDVALEAGFKPIAAGAFIGEHSYSTTDTPVAAGRPDAEDLGKAAAFGKMIREKIQNIYAFDRTGPLYLPGHVPFKELRVLADIAPVTEEMLCTTCMRCPAVCPTAAIHADDPTFTDKYLCIRCCACVKNCPTGARTIDDPRIRQAAEQLNIICALRKEPETYL